MFHDHKEGPYEGLLLVEKAEWPENEKGLFRDCETSCRENIQFLDHLCQYLRSWLMFEEFKKFGKSSQMLKNFFN